MKHTEKNLKIINTIGKICLGILFATGLFMAAAIVIGCISVMVGEIIPHWARVLIYGIFGFILGRVLYIIDKRIKFTWKDENP
jgi:hypothetical protein